MEDNNTNANMNVPNNLEKKSQIFNIVIIVLIVALVAIFVATKIGKKADQDLVIPEEESSETTETESPNASTGSGAALSEPTGVWTTGSIGSDISFDVPPAYYVSHPVIGECDDVVSISTQTSGAPTLPVALIYKEGCVTDPLVTGKYTHREVKSGYVFQTNSSNATVVSLYNRIVASAK